MFKRQASRLQSFGCPWKVDVFRRWRDVCSSGEGSCLSLWCWGVRRELDGIVPLDVGRDDVWGTATNVKWCPHIISEPFTLSEAFLEHRARYPFQPRLWVGIWTPIHHPSISSFTTPLQFPITRLTDLNIASPSHPKRKLKINGAWSQCACITAQHAESNALSFSTEQCHAFRRGNWRKWLRIREVHRWRPYLFLAGRGMRLFCLFFA